MSEEVKPAPAPATAAVGENGAAVPAATPAKTEGATLVTGAEQKPPVVAAPPVVPEVPVKYELKLPEGSKLDAGYVEKLSAFAKDQKLSPDQAQKLLEKNNADLLASEAARAETQKKQLEDWKSGLVAQVEKDPEIGGANIRESVAMASRVVDTYATPAFKQVLNETGLGNHPELVRMLARIGKKHLAEDKLVHGAGSPAGKSIEERWYGSKQKE